MNPDFRKGANKLNKKVKHYYINTTRILKY